MVTPAQAVDSRPFFLFIEWPWYKTMTMPSNCGVGTQSPTFTWVELGIVSVVLPFTSLSQNPNLFTSLLVYLLVGLGWVPSGVFPSVNHTCTVDLNLLLSIDTHTTRFCFWPHLHSWKLSLRGMGLTKMKSLSSLTGTILYLCCMGHESNHLVIFETNA